MAFLLKLLQCQICYCILSTYVEDCATTHHSQVQQAICLLKILKRLHKRTKVVAVFVPFLKTQHLRTKLKPTWIVQNILFLTSHSQIKRGSSIMIIWSILNGMFHRSREIQLSQKRHQWLSNRKMEKMFQFSTNFQDD